MQTIVLIDDSATQLLNAKFILRNAGYNVETVADAEQALERIVAVRPDLIVTDLNMPKLDGISLVHEIRQLAAFSRTPILIMSTDAMKFRYDEARTAGANGWLVKPVKAAALLEALRKLLPQETT